MENINDYKLKTTTQFYFEALRAKKVKQLKAQKSWQ